MNKLDILQVNRDGEFLNHYRVLEEAKDEYYFTPEV